MSICKTTVAFAVSAFALSTFGGGSVAHAFDAESTFGKNKEPRMILRYGYDALKRGNMTEAIGAFRFGAERNDLASQWKLARILQAGRGVAQDHAGAHKLYSRIVERFLDRMPNSQDAPIVANAHVSLGLYALSGVKGTGIRVSPRRAENHFYKAAALYQNADAQYHLAMLYMSGAVSAPQPRAAVRWLGLAARKGHSHAQAELGRVLFYGDGVRRNPVKGLVWMARASANGVEANRKEFRAMRKEAFATAKPGHREAALRILRSMKLDWGQQDRHFVMELNGPKSVPTSQNGQ